jgi:hypothetical protein
MPAQPEKDEKEILNELFKGEGEKYPVIVEKEPEIEDPEVKTYLEKVESDIKNFQAVTDDGGQPLVSPADPQQPIIVLPLTSSSYTQGLAKKVTESIRWLSEWCCRILKIFGSRAVFREGEKKE